MLQLNHVQFGYERGKPVVLDVTAQLSPGQVCAVIGPNAAGKSTLLRLVLGELVPTDGVVRLNDVPIGSLNARRRAAYLSYVPQRGSTSFAFTVEQLVTMGRFALPEDSGAVDHAIERCILNHLRDRLYTQLSVGQQQRVVLARAMAQATGAGQVMLLDEPVSAMDLWHVHHTLGLLRLLATQGLAVLVVLHDLNMAARYADCVWLIHQGKLVAMGSWEDVLRPHVLEPVYRVSIQPILSDQSRRPVFWTDVAADPDVA